MDEVPCQRFAAEGLGLAAARVGDGIARRPVQMSAIALSQLRVVCLLVGPVDLRIGTKLIVDPEAIDPSVVEVRNWR